MKSEKTYEELCAEARERTRAFRAKIKASPTYAQAAAEWRAEYEAEKLKPDWAERDAQSRRDMEEAIAYVESKQRLASTLGNAMRTAQKTAKITQAELAKRLGISQSNISQAMRGNVTSTTLARILAACGCELEVKVRRAH